MRAFFPLITLALVGLARPCYAQGTIRDTTLSMVVISASYAHQVPGGDLGDRFGLNSNIGLSAARKTRSKLTKRNAVIRVRDQHRKRFHVRISAGSAVDERVGAEGQPGFLGSDVVVQKARFEALPLGPPGHRLRIEPQPLTNLAQRQMLPGAQVVDAGPAIAPVEAETRPGTTVATRSHGPFITKELHPGVYSLVVVLGSMFAAYFLYRCARRQARLMLAAYPANDPNRPYDRPWSEIRVTFWAMFVVLLGVLFLFLL